MEHDRRAIYTRLCLYNDTHTRVGNAAMYEAAKCNSRKQYETRSSNHQLNKTTKYDGLCCSVSDNT